MDRLEGMSIVLAVAEAGSLSAAARRQKMPLATVSRKVSELEAHLRTKLFNRSSRALVPTDAGRSYIAAAKRILADVTEAERAASGEYTTPRGDLSVSTLVALGRLCICSRFWRSFWRRSRRWTFSSICRIRTVNLLEEHIDVALRVGDLADSGLIAVRVGEIHRVVCASPAYLKSRGTPKSPDDLSAHDCISYSADAVADHVEIQTRPDRVCGARAIATSLRAISNRPAMPHARASGSRWRSPISSPNSIKSGQLVPLLQDFQPPPQPVSFVYSPNRFMPAKLRAFLDFALPRLRARLADLPKGVAPRKQHP